MASQTTPETVVIAKGEQHSIPLKPHERFSVGNKEIIQYLHAPNGQQLKIKGRSIGFSDIVLTHKNLTRTINVFVLDKRAYLKNYQIIEVLKTNQIEFNIHGRGIVVSKGEIDSLANYSILHLLAQSQPQSFLLQSKLTPRLRNEIIGKVYQEFFELGFDDISCDIDHTQINCYFYDEFNRYEKERMNLEKKYYVHFISTIGMKNEENYRISFKLIKIEDVEGKNFSLGLDQVHSLVSSVFERGGQALIEQNTIKLGQQELHIETLAEPEAYAALEKNVKLQIGSEILFQNLNLESNNIINQSNWKFAGLKIQMKLVKQNQRYRLDFMTELSHPGENTIDGNKESSSLNISLNKAENIFKIGVRSTSTQKKGIAGISSIPLLGRIFQSQDKTKNYQYLFGLAKVEKL
ncbi:MAG: hypothetical protein JNM93_13885 [Bacteriovoracaceae bacterium]|nr:hypothetical protein [Bacteriovoracaceae bacterium]